jgi:hypothetical protein
MSEEDKDFLRLVMEASRIQVKTMLIDPDSDEASRLRVSFIRGAQFGRKVTQEDETKSKKYKKPWEKH